MERISVDYKQKELVESVLIFLSCKKTYSLLNRFFQFVYSAVALFRSITLIFPSVMK